MDRWYHNWDSQALGTRSKSLYFEQKRNTAGAFWDYNTCHKAEIPVWQRVAGQLFDDGDGKETTLD